MSACDSIDKKAELTRRRILALLPSLDRVLLDSSGNDNNGTANNGPSFVVSPFGTGNGIKFTGDTQNGNFGDLYSLAGVGVTIDFDLYIDDITKSGNIITKLSGSNLQYYIQYDGTGKINYGVGNGSGYSSHFSYTNAAGTIPFAQNTNYRIRFVFDVITGYEAIYVNGVRADLRNVTGTNFGAGDFLLGDSLSSIGVIAIGGSKVTVDNLRIYKSVKFAPNTTASYVLDTYPYTTADSPSGLYFLEKLDTLSDLSTHSEQVIQTLAINEVEAELDILNTNFGSQADAAATSTAASSAISLLKGIWQGLVNVYTRLYDGSQKTQIVDNAGTNLGTSGNPIRVDTTGTTIQPVSVATLPLPAGAMTEVTGAAILAELRDDTFTNSFLWEDISVNPSIFYREDRVKSQDTGSVTVVYTRLSDNTVVVSLPAGAVPVSSLSDRFVEFFRWYVITAATGIAVGDWLTNTVIINNTTGAVLSSTWYNLTQQTAISAPSYANIRDPEYDNALDATVQATNTALGTLNTNIGAKADAVASDNTSPWSGLSLLKGIFKRQNDGSQKSQLIDSAGANQGTPANPLIVSPTAIADIFPASQNITTRDLATLPVVGYNGQPLTAGNPTAGSAATFDVSSIETAEILIGGTATGSLVIEAIADSGLIWHYKMCTLPGTNYSGVNAVTAVCVLFANVTGCKKIRIRAASAITGTYTVTISESINARGIDVLNPMRIWDPVSNQIVSVKAASIEPVITDTALVVTQREKGQRSSATSNPIVLSTEQQAILQAIYQDASNTGSITNGGGTVNSPAAGSFVDLVLPAGMSASDLQFTVPSAFSGTISFYSSSDGGVTFNTRVYRGSGILNNLQTSTTNNFPSEWRGNVASMTHLRVWCSAYASGTLAVSIRSSKGVGAIFLNAPTPIGGQSTGNTFVGVTVASAASQTGIYEDMENVASVAINLLMTQAGTLTLQFSQDGSTVFSSETYAISANVPLYLAIPPNRAQYLRASTTNTSGVSATLNIEVLYRCVATELPRFTLGVSAFLTDTLLVPVVKSVLAIQTAANTYPNIVGDINGNANGNIPISQYLSKAAVANILNGSATTAVTIITVPANKSWKGKVHVSGSRRTAAALAVAATDCNVHILWTPGTGGTPSYIPVQTDFSTPGQALTVLTGTSANGGSPIIEIEVAAGTTAGTLALAQTNCDQFFGSCSGYII